MTFTNYFINGFKIEGTNTWTNTSIAPGRSWTRRTENGKSQLQAADGGLIMV
ncbi:MAG: hypothetical protein IPL54_16805 [Chitinophagaceae bacterium]|nr:hypothetical protein [Chitinophagaceae bacterium]